jgi:S1-C subfamily serine protease
MRFHWRMVKVLFAAAGCVLCGASASTTAGGATAITAAVEASNPGATPDGVSGAICPIVFPVDESPAAKGYQYIFYGNAFFISREGYLLTAAHVLHSFGNGGQPYILVSRNEAPPRMLKAEVIAVDREHDVAVLRATPNPFQGNYRVAVLSPGADTPVRGADVVVAALRPSRRQPRTFETELQDRSEARVVDYQSSRLEKGLGETELMLFNHEVILGQSGAPVLSAAGHDVVGFIEGQWLHPAASLAAEMKQGATTIGAAVPIRYAMALLREKGISWRTASGDAAPEGRGAAVGELH